MCSEVALLTCHLGDANSMYSNEHALNSQFVHETEHCLIYHEHL